MKFLNAMTSLLDSAEDTMAGLKKTFYHQFSPGGSLFQSQLISITPQFPANPADALSLGEIGKIPPLNSRSAFHIFRPVEKSFNSLLRAPTKLFPGAGDGNSQLASSSFMDAQPTSSFSDIGDLFSNLYVFGDSLTDIGNIKNVTEFVQPFDWLFGLDIPVAPPPTPEGVPPYFEGRFSNGPVWIDIVADSLGKSLTASSKLSVFRPGLLRFPSPITVTQEGLSVSPYFNGNLVDANVNFAFGGANTDQTGLGGGDFDTLIPGALKQVGWLEKDLARSRESIAPEALVIYWFGPNDYWTNPQADPETTVGNIEEGLTRLIDMGAQNLLVPNMPNLSKVPRFNEAEGNPKPPYDSQVINDFSLHHNALLQETLDGLIGEYPDVNFIQLDVNALFEEALDPLSDFGFTNTVHPFLSPLTPMNADPKDYLFWDDIHPTAGAHDILAHTALTELQEFFLPAEGSLFQTQFDQRTPSLV